MYQKKYSHVLYTLNNHNLELRKGRLMIQAVSFKGSAWTTVTKTTGYETNIASDMRQLRKIHEINIFDILSIKPKTKQEAKSTLITLKDQTEIEIGEGYIFRRKMREVDKSTTKTSEWRMTKPKKDKSEISLFFESVHGYLEKLIELYNN